MLSFTIWKIRVTIEWGISGEVEEGVKPPKSPRRVFVKPVDKSKSKKKKRR